MAPLRGGPLPWLSIYLHLRFWSSLTGPLAASSLVALSTSEGPHIPLLGPTVPLPFGGPPLKPRTRPITWKALLTVLVLGSRPRMFGVFGWDSTVRSMATSI
ncbi:hypothetical protein CVT25_003132 [Psilocybe cyanescens]|uniref:Secreted protein n=1 Tax=Psilocybe cyanescens TaxID=93625 RepID=A0A409XQV1_PSICY|nr:hypothetical protein CVT25_003132 [Psilocybe cyanescens]